MTKGDVIYLTGTVQALNCLEAARKTEDKAEAEALLRMHTVFMEKTNLGRVGAMRAPDPSASTGGNKVSSSVSGDDDSPEAA